MSKNQTGGGGAEPRQINTFCEFEYAQLEIGQTATFSAEITNEMMEGFAKISGDKNPLHMSDKFAKEKGFPARVVYGMLVSSLYSRLAGMYIPGKNCLLQTVKSYFLSPVFLGDVLTVEGKITEKHDSIKQIVIKANVFNQEGKKVARAVIEAGCI